jgi:FkbM family methyltransferase
MNLKALVRGGFNRLGFDITPFHSSSERTLLGITELNIDAVIDVGANEGQFARMIAGVFPDADIFCFEPLEEPYRKLSHWACSQNSRVRCFKVALGDQEGDVEMHLHKHHTPSSSLLSTTEVCGRLYPQTRAQDMERVRLTTLDQAMANLGGEPPSGALLKLDVQGFEDRVLRGASRVLHQCIAVLLEVNIVRLYDEQADFLTLVQLLSEAGFSYAGNLRQRYNESGRVIYADTVFMRSLQ